MCGVAGLIWKTKQGRQIDAFREEASLLAHRGPDGYGEYIDEYIFLIHYRLAIIDLSDSGRQPFALDQSNNIGVYNGELYNYKELAQEYQLHVESRADTEVFFRLLEQHGQTILRRFNGIFSFAWYQRVHGTLALGRDRLGVKPLYYIETKHYFAFASEAKVLYSFLDRLPINFQVLNEFLHFGNSTCGDTLVCGVRKLAPGTVLNIDIKTFVKKEFAYWRISRNIPLAPPKRDDKATIKRTVRKLLEAAVTRQCISDVPVGAYLSGGLDSSVIVALAARATQTTLSTFSVSFEGSKNSELPLARQIAAKYKTDHYEFEVTTRHLETELEELILQYDEPFADPAIIPLHLMAQKCSRLAKVVLQGDGGDELFAGYGRHLDLSQYYRRTPAFWLLGFVHPYASRRKAFRDRAHRLSALPLARRLALLAGASELRAKSIGIVTKNLDKLLSTADCLRAYRRCAENFKGMSRTQQMLFTDMEIILPNTFLEKVDKINMWHGIEARVPLLDNDLVDYVMSLPAHVKISHGQTKKLLREVVIDILPESVLHGRKMSFGTPMDTWLRTLLYGFAKNVLQRGKPDWNGLLNFDRLFHLLEEHKRGQANNATPLWRCIVLLIWLNRYRDKVSLEEMRFNALN